MTALSAQESMNTIGKFIREVGATEKLAAEANSEPGSVGGETEHPVKNVDDHTDPASEGFRSKENDKDVKAEIGSDSVDSTPVATAKSASEGKSQGGAAGDPVQDPGSAASDQLQIGTAKEPTGDDPPVETAGVKAQKDDAGGPGGHTSHPASTDNNALDGLKYAAAELEQLPLDQLSKIASDLNNAILAELAVTDFRKSAGEYKKDEDGSSEDIVAPSASNEDDDDDEKIASDAAQAGWELGGIFAGSGIDKQAATALVEGTLEQVVKEAVDQADGVINFLHNYQDEAQKVANEEAMAAMLGGEEEMPEEDPMAAMAGPEVGGEEEMPAMGMEEGMEEGGGDELAMILEELGVSPEELAQAIEAEEAGAGGAPDMGGEMAPAEDEVAAEGMEVEASAKQAAAKSGQVQENLRDYITELVQRSRH